MKNVRLKNLVSKNIYLVFALVVAVMIQVLQVSKLYEK